MAKDKPGVLEIKTFADHHVITPPNPLQNVLRRVAEKDLDDPVARAEKALAGLSGEFGNWMGIEADRLTAAHAAILRNGFTNLTRDELFRAAHDIKGDAATFGYPSAGAAAESLCRIIEHAPDLDKVPSDLIAHHINAIQAIVRERTKLDTVSTASELCAVWRTNISLTPIATVPSTSKQSWRPASHRGSEGKSRSMSYPRSPRRR
jgi:HPt (histidine-containing phosphotransfer) domain-containing protein